MPADAIYFSTPTRKVDELSTMTVLARFRDRATNADIVPTTVDYRLDTLEGSEITGWTAVSPQAVSSVTLSANQNRIHNNFRVLETKVLTVASDRNLPSEYRDSLSYQVRNEAVR